MPGRVLPKPVATPSAPITGNTPRPLASTGKQLVLMYLFNLSVTDPEVLTCERVQGPSCAKSPPNPEIPKALKAFVLTTPRRCPDWRTVTPATLQPPRTRPSTECCWRNKGSSYT